MAKRNLTRKGWGKGILKLAIGIVAVFVLSIISIFVITSLLGVQQPKTVAVLNIDVPITTKGIEPTIFSDGIPAAKDIADKIKELNKRGDVAAIVIVVDSPGGSATATHTVYNAVKDVDKPIVVYVDEIATSGAYYLSAPADYIYADPNSIVGSIGVIYEGVDLSGLFQNVGINLTTIKAGKYKDMGNPGRKMTKKEQEIIEEILKEAHNEFKNVVMENRGDRLKGNLTEIFDGRIFSGRQAKSVGLVDDIGTLDDAIKKAGELAGIKGKPVVINVGIEKSASIINLASVIRSIEFSSEGRMYGVMFK